MATDALLCMPYKILELPFVKGNGNCDNGNFKFTTVLPLLELSRVQEKQR